MREKALRRSCYCNHGPRVCPMLCETQARYPFLSLPVFLKFLGIEIEKISLKD